MTTDSEEEEDRGTEDPFAKKQPNKASYYVPPTEDELFRKEQSKILQVHKVKDIQNLWLSIYPGKQDFSHVLSQSFQQGFDSLLNFERWNIHEEKAVYDTVLKSYD